MDSGIWFSLGLYFLLMLAIGFHAWRKSTSSSEDYLLAGRQLHPAIAALSAGASDMSGWLLLGLPGTIFIFGLHEAWIGIGLWCGALLNWLLVAPRLREQTERYDNALTIPAFLASRFPSRATALRVTSALIVVVFFAVYTAAGLVAGGKLFDMAFSGLLPFMGMSDYQIGVWLTLIVVLVYTSTGGFLAVSMTDFVQGCIMLLALVIIPLVLLFGEGPGPVFHTLSQIEDPVGYLSWTHGLGLVAWLSAVAWGLGYFGQPHIIVRFMAVRSLPEVATARNIAMSWMFVSLAGAISMALFGRAWALHHGLEIADPETLFILLSDLLFNPWITGFLYAALLAAVMSTISSQLLVASSSLTEDFYRLFLRRQASEKEAVFINRLSVVLVGLVAVAIAGDPNSQVLGLVSHAWAGFGAAFGPMILLALIWPRASGTGALASLITGALVVIAWIALGWNQNFFGLGGVYEIIPGFIAALLAMVIFSGLGSQRQEYRPAQ